MYLTQCTNWGHFPDRIGKLLGKTAVPGEKPLGARHIANIAICSTLKLSVDSFIPGHITTLLSLSICMRHLCPFSSMEKEALRPG